MTTFLSATLPPCWSAAHSRSRSRVLPDVVPLRRRSSLATRSTAGTRRSTARSASRSRRCSSSPIPRRPTARPCSTISCASSLSVARPTCCTCAPSCLRSRRPAASTSRRSSSRRVVVVVVVVAAVVIAVVAVVVVVVVDDVVAACAGKGHSSLAALLPPVTCPLFRARTARGALCCRARRARRRAGRGRT